MLAFVVGEAVRDLRRAGRVALSAILLITVALAAVGAFWTVTSNLGAAVTHWRDRVRVIAYNPDLVREADVPDSVEGLTADSIMAHLRRCPPRDFRVVTLGPAALAIGLVILARGLLSREEPERP